jgi:hypothetical protein
LFVGGFYLQLFVGGVMSCLRHLCLLVYNGVEHILCSVFCFICLRLVVCASFSVLVILDCPVSNVYLQFLCIGHS